MGTRDLNGQAVLLAGGSRGIGRAIAEALSDMGANISLIGRNRSALEQTSAALSRIGSKPNIIVADLTKYDDINSAFDSHMTAFGRVDILINNAAARSCNKPVLDIDINQFNRLINLNITTYFLLSQLACRDMKKRNWGRVINITSSTALKARPNMADYSISKAGELMLTRQFAVEMAPFGITVNAIAPTLTKTEFSEWQWNDDQEREKVLKHIPMGRLAEPEDTSTLAAFLASKNAGMITGAIIPVDGGALA